MTIKEIGRRLLDSLILTPYLTPTINGSTSKFKKHIANKNSLLIRIYEIKPMSKIKQ